MFVKKHKWLALTLGVSLVASTGGLHSAGAVSIDELKNKIEESQEKQDEKKQEIEKKKENLGEVKDKKQQTTEEIASLEQEIAAAEQQINEKQDDISATENKIASLKEKIKETQKRIKQRNELLKDRVRVMYQSGGTVDYLSVLLGSQSFSDFLDRVFALNLIAEQDKRLLEEQKADKKQLEEDKTEVEHELAKLEDQLRSLESMKAGLNEKKQRKNKLVKKLEAKADDLHNEISEEEKAMQAIEAQISDLIKKREAERKRREAERKRREEARGNNTGSHSGPQLSGSGQFAVPLPAGSYRISSGFGVRTHPVTGAKKGHKGIDLAAPKGTPIFAADSGTVLYAGTASGFGHWIVIDHNNGYYTTYGHMYGNQLYVSPGEQVSKGQKIAAVGSDGTSTGNHLHFEISKGGINNQINPAQFF